MSRSPKPVSIGELSRLSGMTAANIRAWERRYGFPVPEREAGGHRRYSAAEVERVLHVLDQRKRGLGIQAAIERVPAAATGVPSFFATLREHHPELQTMAMEKRHLLLLTRAVEDESLARAERGVLIGTFQREHFYRQSESRWRKLSQGSAAALAFADFEGFRSPPDAPVEIPLERSHPLNYEWALVCDAPNHSACLIGWEAPGPPDGSDAARKFEAVLSLDPEVVREAAEIALVVAEPFAPELTRDIRGRLAEMVEPSAESQLRLATDITARTVSRLP